MLLAGRPLYDNLADSQLFVMPPQWDEVVRAIDRNLNVLVAGPRGSGKTSLLHQIQHQFRGQSEPVRFVDGTAASDVLELVERVRHALRGGEPGPLAVAAETAVGAFAPVSDPIAGASRALEVHLRAIGEAHPAIVLLDASSAPEAVFDLFGRMRDVLWQQQHRWVVAIDDSDRTTVQKPPADAFFDLVIELGQWSTQRLVDMLVRRQPEEEGIARDMVVRAAAGAEGSPREAIRALSHAVVFKEDPNAFLSQRADLLDRASALGRAPAMLMAELLDREQAGPSDGDLQQALGVSRARLNQMFGQLEDAGLVVARSERPSGPGRPRLLYRPRLAQ